MIDRAALDALRAAVAEAEAAAGSAAMAHTFAEAMLRRLQGQPRVDPERLAAAVRREQETAAAAAEAEELLAEAAAAEAAALAGLPGQLDPTVPCLLLPVRLETRFGTDPGSTLLQVRIYPDEIHLDAHERGLTADEVALGSAYWHALFATPGSPAPTPDQRIAAWEQLVRRVGPARGAYVAAALTPRNAPPEPPDLPPVPGAAAPWTRPPQALAMPERWRVRAWRDGVLVAQEDGARVPHPLPAGPGPQGIDAGADWMTDFRRAVDAGMGMELDVGARRVDVLTVVGVRGTDTPAQGAELFARLLHGHHFTSGLDLIAPGTPTNNAPGQRSDARAHTAPPDVTHRSERAGLDVPSPVARGTTPGTDAAALSGALGLGAAAAGAAPADVAGESGPLPDPLATMPAAADREVAAAGDMATVLWPATWGYAAAQLLDRDAEARAGRAWVTGTVTPDGPLPAIRVGPQPYGVLPVTPAAAWRSLADPADIVLLTTGPGGGADLLTGYDLAADDTVRGSWTHGEPPPGGAPAWALTAAAVGDRSVLLALAVDPAAQTATLYAGEGPTATLRWGPAIVVPPGVGPGRAELTGAGAVAAARLSRGDGPQVVVVLEYLDPRTRRHRSTLRIGTADPSGTVTAWSSSVAVPVPTPGARLAAACLIVPEGARRPALVVLHRDGNRLLLSLGLDLTAAGGTLSWSAPADVPLPPDLAVHTASVTTLAEGRAVLVHWTGETPAGPVAGYVMAPSLDRAGTALPDWGPVIGTPAPSSLADVAATAVAVTDAGPDPVPGLGTPAGRIALLRAIRGLWREPVDDDRVPRVHPDPAAGSASDMIEVLGADAVSSSVAARGAVGPVLAENLWQLVGRELGPVGTGYRARLEAAIRALATLGELLAGTRLGRVAYEGDREPVPAPLVTEEPDHRDQAPLPDGANYLRWAADSGPVALHQGRAGRGGGSGPLLERLVRHATLQAWADAALDARPPDGIVPPLLDPELVDVADLTEPDPVTPVTLTAWRHLVGASLPADHPRFPGDSVLDVLTKLVSSAETGGATDPLVASVVAHRAALRRLAESPAGTLRRLAMGTLDISGHRLDAWFTAVATDRLRALRAAQPAGLHLGGYGIAVDLEARTAPLSAGYTLAPSLAHAATAAVARSGYLAHADDPDGGRLELQLTGRRVRSALKLLDGLAAGHGLPALLGQAFERGLHDLPGDLDLHLSALRAIAPATAGKRVPAPTSGTGAAEARGPLDGLALLRAHQQGTLPWGTTPAGETVPLPAPGDPARTAIEGLLDDLGDGVDAVGDLAVAEAVHQTVLGNPVRAGALLDAVNRGEPVRAEPEVVRSPLAGVGVTHRVLVLLPADTPTGGWSTGPAATPRAAADPALEAWVGTTLGAPDRIRWRADFTGAAGATVNAEYTLAALELGALDLVAWAGAPDVTEDGGLPASATVNALLLAHAAAHPPAGAGPTPELVLDRVVGWEAADLAVPEALELARRLGLLLGRARPARPADLTEPGVDPGTPADAGLADRAAAATASLAASLAGLRACFPVDDALRAALSAELPGLDATELTTALDLPPTLDPGGVAALAQQPADPSAARAALLSLALHGVPGAAPEAPGGADPAADLRRQAARVARIAAGRLEAAATAASPTDVLRTVLGEATPALPVFAAPDPAALRAALETRADAADAWPLDVADWLDGAAEVRPALAGLRDLGLVTAACGRDGTLRPAVAQLPVPAAGETDRWAALQLPDTDPPARQRAGVVGIAIAGPLTAPGAPGSDDPLAGPLAGLFVDEWVEVVPARSSTAAVTFHVDAPGGSPPQSLLLAVSPDPRSPWTTDLLEEVVLDTIDLARQRMVDPDLVPALGHLLPLLHFARNDGDGGLGDTVATPFTAR